MEQLFIMYNLKKDINRKDFFKYMKKDCKPLELTCKSTHGFEVYEVIGSDKGKKDFDILEVITVDSYKDWVKFQKTDLSKKNAIEWDKYADDNSTKLLITRKKK